MELFVLVVSCTLLHAVVLSLVRGEPGQAAAHLITCVGSLALMVGTGCPLFSLVVLYWAYSYIGGET